MSGIHRCVIGAGEKEGLVKVRLKDPYELSRPSVRSRSSGSFCAALLGIVESRPTGKFSLLIEDGYFPGLKHSLHMRYRVCTNMHGDNLFTANRAAQKLPGERLLTSG